MNSPLVSIIIPTFNRPDHLERAIESSLKQDYENIEIIVVDDCSDLNLERFRGRYPTVKFLKNDANRGACYSRNRGLSLANGVYINFLDDDDELFPDKIRRQVEKFQTSSYPKLGMITCHSIDGRSGKEKVVKNAVEGNIYKDLLAKYIVAGTETVLFKASVLEEVGGFDENLKSSQEYDLFIRASEKFEISFVDEVLTRRNRSVDQISLNFDKKIQGAKRLFKKHDERYRDIGLPFWIRMRLKLYGLICRFFIGKYIGEKAYRLTILD